MTTAAYPVALTLSPDRRTLSIAWDDGGADAFAAAALRAACRCAECRRRAIDGPVPAPDPALAIAGLQLIGDGAVNLSFADRHARGIYPWSYLKGLAGGAGAAEPDGPR